MVWVEVFYLQLFPYHFTVYAMQVRNSGPSKTYQKRKRGRPPHLRHPLGVLRNIIGKTQQEFALLLGDYSHHTIEAIERGALELSEQLAQEISNKTNINVGWLLRGDPRALPVDTRNRPYTRKTFELARVREHPAPGGGLTLQELLHWAADKHCRRVLGIIASAVEKGTADLCDYRLTEALDNLEKRFGCDLHPTSQRGLIAMLMRSQIGPKPCKANSKAKKKQEF